MNIFTTGAYVAVAPAGNPSDIRKAKIVYVSMEANPSSHTFLARASIANPKHTWRAGLKMQVRSAPEPNAHIGPKPPKPAGK